MKIVICGKGGSGKSTISTLTARKLAEAGYNVLLIDGDESNLGLHKMMGVDAPVIFMDNLGGKKGFKAKMNSPLSPGGEAIFGGQVTMNNLPDECVSTIDGIKLMSIGKIHHSGEGCACPMGSLSRLILSKLLIGEKDIVLIDTAAGIEHFGRGIDEKCDLLLSVIDPTYESFMLGKKMAEISKEAGMELRYILNKVDSRVETKMREHIDTDNVIAKIPNSESIFMSSLEGAKITVNIEEVDNICTQILQMKKNPVKKTLMHF